MLPIEIVKNKIFYNETIFDWWLARNRFKGSRIVFTNGCFDVLHRGHVELLAGAASYGDVLVIGLNTDKSVKRLKGETRPLQDEHTRALVLASLHFVDGVVFFEEETPAKLIRKVSPDVLVKGGDYKKEEIVGYDTVSQSGGQVIILEFIPGYSTTSIINRI